MDQPKDAKPETTNGPPRKRKRLRYALHTSHVLAVLVSACLLLYLIALPAAVRRVVRSTFADLGYPGATFSVRTATLWAVELADIRPGSGGAAVIRSAMVRFSPIEVFGGRLRTIELTGADVPFVIKDGVAQFSLAPKPHGEAAAAPTPTNKRKFPFDRLDVLASTLNVDWEGRRIVLPVQGSLTPDGEGGKVALETFLLGSTIPITGTLDNSGTAVDLSASAENLSVAGIRTVIPWTLLNYPFQTSGRADVRVGYVTSGGRAVVRLHVAPKNVWLAAQPGEHQLAVQRVDGAVDVEFGPGMKVGPSGGTLRVGRVAWDDVSAERVELAVRGKGGDALEYEATLASDGWRLTSLKGSVAGLTSGLGPLTASAEFRAGGQPPHQVIRLLNQQGVMTDDMGPLSVRGTAKFSMSRDARAKRPWEVALPSLRVSMDPGAVVLQGQGVTLAGVSSELSLTGAFTQEGGSLMVAPGSRVEVGSLQKVGGLGLKREGARETMLSIGVVGQGATITYGATDSNGGIGAQLPNLDITVSRTTLNDRGSGTNVGGIEGVLHIGGDVSGRKVNMVALPDSWVGFQSLQSGGVHADATRVAVLPMPERPLFDGRNISVLLGFTTPISAVAGVTKVAIKTAEVAVTADLFGTNGPSVAADVKVDGGAVNQPNWGLTKVVASVPVSWNAGPAKPGTFLVGAATVGGYELPAVRGTLAVVDRSVAVTASSEVAKGAAVRADANVEWTPAGMRGRAATTMPSFTLDDPAALGKIWKPAAAMGLTGTFSMDGEVLFNGPLIKPRFSAYVKDAKLTSAAYDLSVEGMNGSVTVDNFEPLSGPGLQRIRVEKLHLGKIDLSKGGVEFRVERPDSLHVERSRWTWVGGQVYTYDLRINPAKPQVLDAVVYADRLDLKQLLGAVAQGQASGSGQLYGRLPLKINWPDVSFGNGFLYATGGGGIEIGKKADEMGDLLDKSDPRFATDPTFKQVKARIIDALRNFDYDTLKVDFVPKDGGLTASFTINGKGRTGEHPQELGLTVNVNGIDQLLSQALVIKKALTGQ